MDKRLQEMLDHHEIRRTLAEYCHACDRGDANAMARTYTGEDSFDDHGHVKASGPEYSKMMAELIQQRTEACWHVLGQSLIDIDGDTANAETFFLGQFCLPASTEEPRRINQLAGRFVDKLERIEGDWKIKHRTCVRDTSITFVVERDDYANYGFMQGSRDLKDPGAAMFGLVHQD